MEHGNGFCSEGLNRLKEHLLNDIAKGICDGCVTIVARNGKIEFFEAMGADENGKEIKKDNIFLMMSSSKALTAAEILRLADTGKIDLGDKVCQYIPEFAMGGKKDVTIYQLLNHTGGVYAGLGFAPGMEPQDLGNLEKSYKAACFQPLWNMPGERVRYVPWAGFAVLAEIIRRMHGGKQRFADIMDNIWFKPLGMNDTSFGFNGDAERVVPTYSVDKDSQPAQFFRALGQLMRSNAEFPAGNAWGTAEDMLKFAEMLRNGGSYEGRRYLSETMCRYAYRNHTGEKSNDGWDFEKVRLGIPHYPAMYALGGGYARGEGDFFTAHASAASPNAFAAVGGGSTMVLTDKEFGISAVFLAAGLNEGLEHFIRLHKINNMIYAALK